MTRSGLLSYVLLPFLSFLQSTFQLRFLSLCFHLPAFLNLHFSNLKKDQCKSTATNFFFNHPVTFIFLLLYLLQWKLKVRPSCCLWRSSNVMRTQHQRSFGSTVSFYRSLSSLSWKLAQLRIAIWVIIISLLQAMVPVLLLHKNSLHHSAGNRPSGFCCSDTHSCLFRLRSTDAPLVLLCAFSSVKPGIQEVQCLFTQLLRSQVQY